MNNATSKPSSDLVSFPGKFPISQASRSPLYWIKKIQWKKAFYEHLFYLGLCLTFFIVGLATIYAYFPQLLSKLPASMAMSFGGSIRMMSVVIAIYSLGHLIKHRPKSPIKSLLKGIDPDQFFSNTFPQIVLGVLGMVLVIPMFIELKLLIPLINPFSYDELFESMDRFVHFGYQPWELLKPITNYPWVTMLLHRNYYIWFPVIYVTFFWQVITRHDPALRMQFISAFLACWIVVGSIFAIMFSSVGPIFYNQFYNTPIHAYSGAMAYLEQVNSQSPMFMFNIRDYLWIAYQGNTADPQIKGISAMPSMHVSIATLLALFGWRRNKWLGIAYTVFALMIAIGSVHLLWHYAIDAYVAIALTVIIWWIAGKVAAGRTSGSEQSNHPAQVNA